MVPHRRHAHFQATVLASDLHQPLGATGPGACTMQCTPGTSGTTGQLNPVTSGAPPRSVDAAGPPAAAPEATAPAALACTGRPSTPRRLVLRQGRCGTFRFRSLTAAPHCRRGRLVRWAAWLLSMSSHTARCASCCSAHAASTWAGTSTAFARALAASSAMPLPCHVSWEMPAAAASSSVLVGFH